MPLKKLRDLVDIASGKGKKRIVVAVAHDEYLMNAIGKARKSGFIEPILIGDKAEVMRTAEISNFDIRGTEIIHEPDIPNACNIAARMIKNGEADVIVKGLVKTSILVKAVLDKENRMKESAFLSHVAFFETPYYHKLLGLTDAAVNIAPDLNDKVEMIKNAVEVCHRIGIKNPGVGVLAAVEVVNEKIEATVHAAKLKQLNIDKKITGCAVDGPFALDNAISTFAAKYKGIDSGVAGDADLLVTPDINSGNILYKSLNFLGGAVCAAIVTGAGAPFVLTSRSDSDKSKFYSIAFAVAML
jgi:phosphate butyryltransferase